MRLRSALVGALIVGLTAFAPVGRIATAAAATSRFVPLGAPTRLIDSRTGAGTQQAPLNAETSRAVQITGSTVPSTATAVLINVTATNTKAGGWLQVFPTGRGQIGASSTLNLDEGGVTLPNASFAPLGDSGSITVYATFTTDFIIDVFGYFTPAATSDAGRLVTVTPTRILDTRSGLGWVPPNPGDSKDCSSFANQTAAQDWHDAYFALFGDVARLDADGDGVVCESGETGTSTGSPTPTPVTPTPSPTPTPTPTPTKPANPGDSMNCGDFATYAAAKAWFDTYFPYYGDVADLDRDGNGLPCESRPGGPGAINVPFTNGKVATGTTITLQVTDRGGVPATGVSAVVLNVTAVGPTGEGWVQVAPSPVVKGASSNLNTTKDVTVANLVVVPLSASGTVDIYTTTGGDLLADVFGYFTAAGSPVSDGGLFVPYTGPRALDTRPSTGGTGVAASSTTSVDLAATFPGAIAFAGNLTSTNSKVNGYLQLSPSPIAIGAHSNLNTSKDGQTIANAFVSPLPANGAVSIYSLYRADILVDPTGYFVGASAT